jgi:hypothetical protein
MVDQIPQAVPPQANIPMPQMGATPPPVPQQQMPQYPFQQAPVQQAPLPTGQVGVRPQQTANITKPTSKISMRTVLVGC